MPKFVSKPVYIEAHRWFWNGDHPDDNSRTIIHDDGTMTLTEGQLVRRYRSPEMDGRTKCVQCGVILHLHGWIEDAVSSLNKEGRIVCPGDWIVTDGRGVIYPQSPADFHQLYDEVVDV